MMNERLDRLDSLDEQARKNRKIEGAEPQSCNTEPVFVSKVSESELWIRSLES
jgi:hypothetical protein